MPNLGSSRHRPAHVGQTLGRSGRAGGPRGHPAASFPRPVRHWSSVLPSAPGHCRPDGVGLGHVDTADTGDWDRPPPRRSASRGNNSAGHTAKRCVAAGVRLHHSGWLVYLAPTQPLRLSQSTSALKTGPAAATCTASHLLHRLPVKTATAFYLLLHRLPVKTVTALYLPLHHLPSPAAALSCVPSGLCHCCTP